jgi:hypothetical protein
VKPLREHTQLLDGALAPFLNQYFQKLRGLYAGGTRWLHKFDLTKYWTADLRINQEDLHVRLSPRDQAYFEFFTTGNPIVMGSVTQGPVTLTSAKAACIGVTISLEENEITAVPEIRTGARSFNGQDISLVKRAFQVQLIDEPVTAIADPPAAVLGRPKYLRTLYESFAPGHSHTGVHTRSYAKGRQDDSLANRQFAGTLAGQQGASSSHNNRDVLFDVPYQDGYQARAVRDAVLNDGIVDWPRANGIQKVKSALYGQREFAIYIDAFSQVSVFPTSQVDEVNGDVQNVNPKYVTTKPALLPPAIYQMSERFTDWYTANPGDTGIAEFPENDWKISPDGTKACAVVYKRHAVTFDEAAWAVAHITPSIFSAYVGAYSSWQARQNGGVSGTSDQRYVVATGLVEITIDIEITGTKPEEYTLAVTLAELRDAETTDYCTLFAGYVGYDIANADGGLLAAKGDLCVWDIERYYRYPPQTFATLAPLIAPGITPDTLQAFITESLNDHERFWFEGMTTLLIDQLPNPDVQRIAFDVRRTLFSLKNLTSDKELRTYPAPPSGVARPYPLPSVTWVTAPGFHGAARLGSVTPVEARARFSRVDMTTLSYVLLFDVGTQDFRQVTSNLNSPAVGGNPADMYTTLGLFNTFHPACAVYTLGQLREIMFPETMPLVYQPLEFYAEPVQLSMRERITAAATDDFRDSYLNVDGLGPWTFMPQGGGPPGKTSATDWTDADMEILRYWIVNVFGTHPPDVLVPTSALNTTLATAVPLGPLTSWWGALSTYSDAMNQILISNPRFHWQMYSDCIVNALAWSPWSTFFAHPNGTWAYYDQARFYNQDGIPSSQLGGHRRGAEDYNLDYTTLADPTTWEHCIFDRVHFQFTFGDGKTYSSDTTFVQLYNNALTKAIDEKKIPDGEVFDFITPIVLKARLLKLPERAVSLYGLSLQLVWTGDLVTFLYGDPSYQFGVGSAIGGGTGTIDLSLDYLWGAVSPQAASQRITFSSCLLVETL